MSLAIPISLCFKGTSSTPTSWPPTFARRLRSWASPCPCRGSSAWARTTAWSTPSDRPDSTIDRASCSCPPRSPSGSGGRAWKWSPRATAFEQKIGLGKKLQNLILNLGALGKLQQHSMHSAKSRHPNAIKAREQETIILEDDDVDEVFGFYEFVIQSWVYTRKLLYKPCNAIEKNYNCI